MKLNWGWPIRLVVNLGFKSFRIFRILYYIELFKSLTLIFIIKCQNRAISLLYLLINKIMIKKFIEKEKKKKKIPKGFVFSNTQRIKKPCLLIFC